MKKTNGAEPELTPAAADGQPPLELKYNTVFERMLEEFSSDRFSIGDRLPSERQFASQLSVNMATIRRAFRDFVLAGIVEKRIGSGTYLARKISAKWVERTVNMIFCGEVNSAFNGRLAGEFLRITREIGRSGRVIYAMDDNFEEILRSCASFRQPSIIVHYRQTLPKTLCAQPELFVKLSSMDSSRGIPCVLSDDRQGMELLISHLRERGREHIAILGANPPSPLQDFQVAQWEKMVGKKEAARRLFLTDENSLSSADSAFQTISGVTINFDALICLSDSQMLGAMAALRQRGIAIPQDVAVTSIGNTELACYACPPVTSIDSNVRAHILQAIELLDYNHAHKEKIQLQRLVPPALVIRQST